ncbi:DUF3397 domain-containing protein [Alkalicoccus daliensis]|uniref:DUF3397 domain-containing protein n=1 Tax=Alkalicoccus daliensis TaxID=745820 RepID=A0A1G9ZW65_9BACI|nr:DUF3397 domain-containing protein [Alkalicoccus daliensis]SDN24766.1 Protein of unknown function [Alkalicoccus daliensis]
MTDIAAAIIATTVTIPPLVLIIIFMVFKKSGKSSSKAVRMAADLTMPVFMISVYFIVNEVWGINTGWYMILGFIITAAVITTLHWKIRGDTAITIILKQSWRFHFLVYFILYFIVTITGLIYI